MKRSFLGLLVVGVFLTALATIASADDSKDEAIKKDRQQVEGTWRIIALEDDGKKSAEEDVNKLTVVNGSDGTWSLRFDPTKKPKTIDFTPTVGDDKGVLFLGIYELGENTRKMCFAPKGKDRPTEFSSKPGSQYILVTFQREKAK